MASEQTQVNLVKCGNKCKQPPADKVHLISTKYVKDQSLISIWELHILKQQEKKIEEQRHPVRHASSCINFLQKVLFVHPKGEFKVSRSINVYRSLLTWKFKKCDKCRYKKSKRIP